MRIFWNTAVLFLALFALTACVPTQVEPGALEFNQAPTSFPPPEGTAVPESFIPEILPLPPDAAPDTLPVYTMTLEPVPADGDSALAWAQLFGLVNPQVMQESAEMILVLSRDETVSTYEQLTFIRSPYEQVIVYSSGIDRQNLSGPTPLPTPEVQPPPQPTRTPLGQTGIVPETLRIVPPVIVDEGNGRLYTNAAVDGITHTVSLDAVTGNLLTVFGLTGDLALDATRNLLYVDKYPFGLTVIDTVTNEPVNEIQLPSGERSHARPHADPATGNVLLFRDQMLLIADPLAETWQQMVPFTVEGTVCGEPMEEPPTIQQSWFDQAARLLYLSFVDYVCTPWVSYTVVVYDLKAMSGVVRYPGVYYLSGTAVNGRFYGKSWFRLGKTFQWAWQDGQPWLEMTDRGQDFTGAFSGFQVDENRGWLYEMTDNGLQVLEMATMAVVQTVPAPLEGQLVGFNSLTDSLYFMGKEDGRLLVWPVNNFDN